MGEPMITLKRIRGQGVSWHGMRKWVCEYIVNEIKPKVVLDLGCGIGVYGAFIRQLNPKIEMIGLDGFLPYLIQEFTMNFYTARIHTGIERVLDGTLRIQADLVICMDVIEHFLKDDAFSVLDVQPKLAPVMIVSTPLFDYPQQAVGGNELEAHRCWFTEQEITDRNYRALHIEDMDDGNGKGRIGAFERRMS